MIFPDAYIIALTRERMSGTGIEVFMLPTDSTPCRNDSPVRISPTHRCKIDAYITDAEVVQSRVDPVTGITHVQLLHYSTELEDLELMCSNLTLSEHSAQVSRERMTVKLPNIRFPDERLLQRRYRGFCQHIDISHDGRIRGFFLCKSLRRKIQRPWELNQNQHFIKFAIDDTSPDPSQWSIACSQIAPAEWDDEVDPGKKQKIVFDGTRGRLCYHHPTDAGKIVVLDVV